MAKKKWSDLTPLQQRAVVVGGAFETILTVAALRDVAGRPRGEIYGPRTAWVLACFVQPIDPIAYFPLARK
jgi:hypothetical protein